MTAGKEHGSCAQSNRWHSVIVHDPLHHHCNQNGGQVINQNLSKVTIFTAIMLPNLPKIYNLTTWTVIFSLIPTQKFSNGEFKLHSMLCNFSGESHF